ncbi:MAG: hypothetical protein AAGE94_04685 [Acidobacteriota bacterium]
METYTIRVADKEIPLPEGVTVAIWSRERTYWQNPRIRAFLGCIRLLGGVMESNYALLHCSPERLMEIWRKVREVSELMLTQLAPLLDHPSNIPDLEEARSHAEVSLTMLADTVLADLERFPQDVPPEQMVEVRKLLCVSIGKIHAFLQDTFGQLMAADPRSQYNADYFLSRRFPQDVEEAEWLHATVEKLKDYLATLDAGRTRDLVPALRDLRHEQTLPIEKSWEAPEAFLGRLRDELVPKLKEVLALRGIRFHEMEILDRYATDFPGLCATLSEMYRGGREATEVVKRSSGETRAEREQSVRDLMNVHAVLSGRMARLMAEIDQGLRDLVAFVPLWLDGIEMRRALLLKRNVESKQTAGPPSLSPRPPSASSGGVAGAAAAS